MRSARADAIGCLWMTHARVLRCDEPRGMPRTTPWTPPPFHPNRPGLVAPVRCDPKGAIGPKVSTARGPRWRWCSQGFYVPSTVDGSVPEQRIVEAAAVLPAIGVVTGWAALRWLGAVWFDGRTPDGGSEIPVCLATTDIAQPANALLSEERLPLKHIIEVDGLMVATPVWALAFEMRYARSVRDAAVAFDMTAYADLVSIDEYDELVPQLSGWTGIPQMRKARPLLNENSWSPWETRMDHIWELDAGLAKPLVNRPIFDLQGRHIVTPDLFDPVAGLAGEYTGDVHATRTQRRVDRDRTEKYRHHGIEVVVMMQGDSADRGLVAARILQARARARFQPEATRSWTIVPPPRWTPTFSVAQRRALPEELRARLLRHRKAV